MPGGSGATIGQAWIATMNGGTEAVVEAVLADPRVEIAIFLERDGEMSVAPDGSIALDGTYNMSSTWQLTQRLKSMAETAGRNSQSANLIPVDNRAYA